jgi:hypothetical protein
MDSIFLQRVGVSTILSTVHVTYLAPDHVVGYSHASHVLPNVNGAADSSRTGDQRPAFVDLEVPHLRGSGLREE